MRNSLSSEFTGRDQLLDQLSEKLAAGPAAVVAAYGLGGVGKTQLALEYAYRHRDQDDYDLVWWVPAETPLAVVAGLTLLAPALGVAVEADQEATVAAVLAALANRERWLLVFDNAEDSTQLRRYLPRGRGDVLVTSRNPTWGGVAQRLGIDVLSPGEAVELLTNSSGDPDQDAATRLAEALGRLPLALAQAAAYVQQPPGLGLAGNLDRYQYAHAELLARSKPVDYPDTVATTWQLNFDQLARTTPAAVELLRLCAFLAPETPIPLDLLTAAPKVLPQKLARMARDPLALDAIAAALYRSSLISSAPASVRMHRLVQAVTRAQLAETQTGKWAIHAVTLLLAAFPRPPQDPLGWPRAAQLLPHVVTAADHAERWSAADAATAELLNQAGIYLASRAELPAARQALGRSLKIAEAAYGRDHAQVAATLGNLGIVLSDLGELPAARQALERALHVEEVIYGSDHAEVARTLGNLGNVLARLGDLPGAHDALERALRTFEAAYGSDHPYTRRVQQALDQLSGR